MTPVFADTFYFLALVNVADAAHQRAVSFSQAHSLPVVTTTWVLTEVADGLSRSARRKVFVQLLEDLRADSQTLIVPSAQELFDQGVALYAARPDKDWSLTDCISFVVMHERGLSDALTADHHFEQAGFTAMLK
jgi:predicted nucleic acid-binding protein